MIRALGATALLTLVATMPAQEAAAQDPFSVLGGAAAGAIIGGAATGRAGGAAAGAIIGGAIANQGAAAQPLPKTQDPDFIAYCSRKYRSFDPVDGTYLARDGMRYECEYP